MKNQLPPVAAWVEQTLGSLEGAARPVPSPWLYQQVRHRLAARHAEVPTRPWVLRRLAFATALLAVNVLTVAHFRTASQSASAAAASPDYGYPTLSGSAY